MTTVLYPGSFDPLHLGHLDVIEQAAELFGAVVVVAMHNPGKSAGLFDLDTRLALMRECVGHIESVRVESATGLAIDAARRFEVDFIVKGLRNAADFDIEQQMALTNRSVTGVHTVFLPGRADLSFISSRFIREIAVYGGDVAHMVPLPVAAHLGRLFPPGGTST